MQNKREEAAQIPEMKYNIEKPPTGDRVTEFLNIFASILKHSNYRIALEHYIKYLQNAVDAQLPAICF